MTLPRIEHALNEALQRAETPDCPPKLATAVRHAVFPGGARLRPQLCLAVAAACGDDRPAVSDAAAVSVELLHCASLAHDDLPCFDNAALRRGRPSVHAAFGERLAVLAGDALIVLALQHLARGTAVTPERLPILLQVVSQGVGMPSGIAAGQAWECEPQVLLADYQQAKTGALFAAATMAGAAAAGCDPAGWRLLGARIGEAYQVADDIQDVAGDIQELGKPTGQDAALDRPSAVEALGLDGACARLRQLVIGAVDSIPDCPGRAALRNEVLRRSQRFLPKALRREAAAA